MPIQDSRLPAYTATLAFPSLTTPLLQRRASFLSRPASYISRDRERQGLVEDSSKRMLRPPAAIISTAISGSLYVQLRQDKRENCVDFHN